MREWLVQECLISGIQNWMWALALAVALYFIVFSAIRSRDKRMD